MADRIAELEAERDRLLAENMTPVGAVLNNLGQGLTFGFSDELAAGLAAVATAPLSDKTFSEIYNTEVDLERGRLEAAREKYPKLSLVSEIGGAIPTGMGLFKAGMAITKNAPRIARFMGIGAVEGGLYGAGISEEEDRLRGSAQGAGLGAVLGPVGAGIAHVGGRGLELGGRLLRKFTESPKSQARRLVEQALERDQMTPHAARLELEELGPEAVVADILGGNVQGLGRAVTGKPGRARSLGERMLHGRQLGDEMRTSQQQRILQAAGLNPAEIGTFRMSVTNMLRDRSTEAGPHYDRAYAATVQQTESLIDVLSVINKSVIRKARNLMRGDIELLEEIARKYPDTPEGRAAILELGAGPLSSREAGRRALQTPGGIDENSVRFYDYVKRSLDDQIGGSLRQGNRQEARNLINQKNALLSELDEQIPDYAKARQIFSTERAMLDAVDYGRSLLNNRVDLSEVELVLQAMPSGEKEAFRRGVVRGLIDKIESTPETRDFAKHLIDTTRMRELLTHAFPDAETFNSFMRTAVAESRFSNTRNRTLGGSQTTPRLEESVDLNNEVALGQAMASNEPFRMGVAILRSLGGSDTSEETLLEVSQILFNRHLPKNVTERANSWLARSSALPSAAITSSVIAGEKARGN